MGKYGGILPLGQSRSEAEQWEEDRQAAIEHKRPGLRVTTKAVLGLGVLAGVFWVLKKVT